MRSNCINRKIAGRRQERGITIFVVAVVIVAVLGMAALAIDLIALYVAHGQAQRTADAAALAGAKMFVISGFTSNPSAWTTSNLCQSSPPGATAAANQQAEAIVRANNIPGEPVTVQLIRCDLTTTPTNPKITVKVQQTGLPSYFAKIWGQTMNSVSATATAEAYNPAGSGGAPVQVSIKPILLPDCNPSSSKPPCAGPFFTDPIQAPAYIGQSFTFSQRGAGPPNSTYYVLDLSAKQATICPSTAALPTNSCALVGSGTVNGGVYDNMACANVDQNNQVECGDNVNVFSPPSLNSDVILGAQCLIHTNGMYTLPQTGPACSDADSDCFHLPATTGAPVTITGGQSNPNPAFRPSAGTPTIISRSNSIVTVPVYDGATDPCFGASCSVTVTGFVQLGIQYVGTSPGPSTGKIQATVLNASSCAATGGTPISGGGVSSVPVRLISQ